MDAGKECGAPKYGTITREKQNQYRHGIVPDLVAMGAKESDVFELLPYTTCSSSSSPKGHNISLVRLRRDSPKRKEMLDFIFSSVVSGKRISLNNITDAGFITDLWTPEDYIRHYGYLPNSTITHNKADRNLIELSLDKLPLESACISDSIYRQNKRLSNFCTSGQMGILQKMNSAGYGNDEYAAFCIALKWASERIYQEKRQKEKAN